MDSPSTSRYRTKNQSTPKNKGLHCPFTWEKTILHDELETALLTDRLPLAVRPWDSIIKKCHLAFSLCMSGSLEKSSILMTECFMPMLDIPGLLSDCDLTKRYRTALMHVLHSSSAFIRLAHCRDVKSREDLQEFMDKIPLFDSLNHIQQSAIYAIHSKVTNYPGNVMWARIAVELNPEEGQWHSYLAEALYSADQCRLNSYDDEGQERDGYFREILKHNSDAMTLRRDAPEPFLLMAKLMVGIGEKSSSNDSYMLIQNALKKFPDCAYVHEKAADVLQLSQPSFDFLPKSYLLIEPFYKKALKLAGGNCLSLKHKLGLHQVLFGRLKIENYEGTYDEGVENLKQAAVLIPSAAAHLVQLESGTLDVSALGIYLPPILVGYEEESSSDSSQVDKPNKKSTKKRKKKDKN